MWSQKTRYALRALIHLSLQEDRRASAGDISRRCEIPQKYLESILADLRRGGMLESSRGKSGGYRIVREPSTIGFVDVLNLTDPEFLRCSHRQQEDRAGSEEPFLEDLQRSFVEQAKGASLAEVVLKWQALQRSSDYSI
ncbi:RrF2 family transcriptional regulator [Alkalispirochaeta americana]|uniref:RrF2 family transcriptional regulator n=1 Tax=Alkalispirochaeta americana TaxID=159291 RepID=UPI000970CBBF|nr:Rrf2 family transcriptional regulator [Alkalispirochaeta americana]